VRKYYRLTRKGKQLLDGKRAEWAAFHQGVDSVLSGGASALA
jgi:PadR family transcriptional regulator PadR